MGPLRFRGQHDDKKNRPKENASDGDDTMIELEEQTKSQIRKKGGPHRKTFFKSPEIFFSWDWTPSVWILTSIAVLCLSIFIVCQIHAKLPKAMTLSNSLDINDGSERFIAVRAQTDLNTLIDIGPRPTGSNENELVARDFLVNEIMKIKNKTNRVLTVQNTNQVVSGSFYLAMKPVGYISYYDRVQNIVVRLSSSDQQSSTAVLLNCHFDTVPGSPGGGDDGFHCAVMLELLRVLSVSKKKLLHDVIFLFNGAEETVLQASHGFITQHEWAKDVKAFINLEGCGAGGKEILFQTGPNCPWLVETYAKAVPHPHGTVMAEELFQSNFIPSDTDFRIFRDFGHIPGYDFANIDNGFVYHTKYDNGKLIFPGSYQHTGDNVLALVLALASSPQLSSINSASGSVVYYDLLGLWFVEYSQQLGTIINIVVATLSYLTIFWQLFRSIKGTSVSELSCVFGSAVLGTLAGWILSVLYIFLLTQILNWTNHTQSWYRSSFYLFTLYYCSTTFFCVLGSFLFFHQKSKFSSFQQSQFHSLAIQLIWTTCLLLATLVGVRSSFIFLFVVLAPTCGNIALMFCGLSECSIGMWVKIQLLQAIIPLLMGIYNAIIAMSVFIPITNRSGSGMNAELFIALLSAATCLLSISYLVPLSLLVRHVSVVVWIAALHLFGLLAVFIIQPLPFYEWETGESGVLQRVPLWHVERTIYNSSGSPRFSDSGFWMMNMDRSSPHYLKYSVPELSSAQNAANFCGTELFCALPLYSPRLTNYINSSMWIPGPKPFMQSVLQMNAQVGHITPLTRRVTFTVSGPSQMSFMFSPLPGVTATNWSLQADLTPSTEFKGRPAYFIFYQRGLPGPSWTFHIDFKHKKEDSDHYATVALSGSDVDSEHFSPEFNNFMEKFPHWAFISPRASELKIWEL